MTSLLLNPMVNCEPLTHLTYQQSWIQLIILLLKAFSSFDFQHTSLPGYLPVSRVAFFWLVPLHLPNFLTFECPGIHHCTASCSIYAHYLVDVIQAHSFKYNPYASDSQSYISSSSLKHKNPASHILFPTQNLLHV